MLTYKETRHNDNAYVNIVNKDTDAYKMHTTYISAYIMHKVNAATDKSTRRLTRTQMHSAIQLPTSITYDEYAHSQHSPLLTKRNTYIVARALHLVIRTECCPSRHNGVAKCVDIQSTGASRSQIQMAIDSTD
jgi:hypothetical protein